MPSPEASDAKTRSVFETIPSVTDRDNEYGDPIAITEVSGPEWLVVWSDGRLEGTPGADDLGLNAVTVRVTDSGGLTDEITLRIPVRGRGAYWFIP